MSLKKLIKDMTDEDKIITGPYTSWLANKADEGYPPWVVRIIAEQLAKQPRVRSGTFSASSAGRCLRQQELGYLGAPATVIQEPDAQSMNIFNDGKWRHLRHQANLLTARILTRIEVPVIVANRKAYGTLDGMGVVPDDHPRKKWRGKLFGWELKGVNQWQYPRWVQQVEPIPGHLDQIDRYRLLYGVELFSVVYENKSSNEWYEWVLEPDMYRLDDSYRELQDLNTAIRRKRMHDMLPSCKLRQGADWRGCPFAGRNGTCEKAGSWFDANDLQEAQSRRGTSSQAQAGAKSLRGGRGNAGVGQAAAGTGLHDGGTSRSRGAAIPRQQDRRADGGSGRLLRPISGNDGLNPTRRG